MDEIAVNKKKRSSTWVKVMVLLILVTFIPWVMDKCGVDLAATLGLGEELSPTAAYLLLTWLPTLGNVMTVATVLGWFGAPMISKMLADRKDGIEKAINDATAVKDASEADCKQAQERLSDLPGEITQLKLSYATLLKDEQAQIAAETDKEEARYESEADVVFELQSNVAAQKFQREVMTDALAKAREDIISRISNDSALRDRLIDQGIASLNLK